MSLSEYPGIAIQQSHRVLCDNINVTLTKLSIYVSRLTDLQLPNAITSINNNDYQASRKDNIVFGMFCSFMAKNIFTKIFCLK